MFEHLSDKLRSLSEAWSRKPTITDKELRKALISIRSAFIEADVSMTVIDGVIERMRMQLEGKSFNISLTPHQAIVQSMFKQLQVALGDPEPLKFSNPLTKIALVGLQGVGKTTTCAKLALNLTKQGKKCLMVSLDIHRPAARTQLASLGSSLKVDVCQAANANTIEDILNQALTQAKKGYDVLLIDTAGRQHIDETMMGEVAWIHKASSPHETLLVTDAMLGQESITIAQEFHKATPLSGLILTRVDGDTRGGAALSIRECVGIPIKFMGTGEKPECLEDFDPKRIAKQILGMGDTLALIEKLSELEEEEDLLTSHKDLTYNDLLRNINKMRKLGGVKKILTYLPSALTGGLTLSDDQEATIKRKMAIIQSMTPKERAEKHDLTSSRKRRIVQGSGTTIQEVNQLIKQLKSMKVMMKRMSNPAFLKNHNIREKK